MSGPRPSEGEGVCHVCERVLPRDALRPFELVRPGVSDEIAAMRPGWEDGMSVCGRDLAEARRRHVERLLEAERGEVGDIEREVAETLASRGLVAENPVEETEGRMSPGDRIADRVAAFGGSWTFILGFLGVLVVWIGLNTLHVLRAPFDPYPFILLNLMLSMIAALQAPVIMMSQRRQEQKDRARAENDYRVNLKAELEVRQLHEKMDHLLAHQWERLAELQRIQIDMLEERRNFDDRDPS